MYSGGTTLKVSVPNSVHGTFDKWYVIGLVGRSVNLFLSCRFDIMIMDVMSRSHYVRTVQMKNDPVKGHSSKASNPRTYWRDCDITSIMIYNEAYMRISPKAAGRNAISFP